MIYPDENQPGEPLLPAPHIPTAVLPVKPVQRYAQAMATDFRGWRNALPENKRQTLDFALSAYKDDETGKRALTNMQWIAEQEGLPPGKVAASYANARMGFARKSGWGDDAGKDDSAFYAKVTEAASANDRENVKIHGLTDDKAPMMEVPTTIGMMGGVVQGGQRPDTEAARKSREESLLARGYWSAAEQMEFGDGMDALKKGKFPDKVGDYLKWWTANKKDLIPGNEEKYWRMWSAQYDAGTSDRKTAIAAANEALPFLARRSEVYGSLPVSEALAKFRPLTKDQRRLAMDYMQQIVKQPGKLEALGVKTAEGTGAGIALVRMVENIQENIVNEFDRTDLQDMAGTFRAGQNAAIFGGLEGEITPGAIVSGNQAIKYFAMGDTEGYVSDPPKYVTLTQAQADAANREVNRRLEDIEFAHELRGFSQEAVTGLRKDSVPAILAQGAAQSAGAMAFIAVPGVGWAAMYESYKHESYQEFVRDGMTREQATAMAPFVGAAQAVADRVSLGFLKKNPVADQFLRKWATSAMTRGAGRFAGITAAETGTELGQNHLAKAYVQDFAHVMDATIPGTDWNKVGKQLVDAAPETLLNMMVLAPLGTGAGALQDIKNVDALARDEQALRYLGFRPDQIANVIYASDGRAGEVFKEEFQNRSVSAPGDIEGMSPVGAADLVRQIREEGVPQGITANTDEAEQTAIEPEVPATKSFLDQMMDDVFPEAMPEQRERLKSEISDDFLREHEQSNLTAGVTRVFRDNNGWHIEKENGAILDAGSLEAALDMRDEMAALALKEETAELTKQREEAAKKENAEAEKENAEAPIVARDVFSESVESPRTETPTTQTHEQEEDASRETREGRQEELLTATPTAKAGDSVQGTDGAPATPQTRKEVPGDQPGTSDQSASAASSETPATGSSAPNTLNQGVSDTSNVNTEKGDARDVPEGEESRTPQERRPTDDLIGIKNAKVDEERAKLKLPPLMEPLRRADPVVWDEAMKEVQADELIGQRLVIELRENPRVITDTEHAILLHEMARKDGQYHDLLAKKERAADAKDETTVTRIDKQLEDIRDQIQDIGDATKVAGTEVARSLRYRQIMLDRDWNLTRVLAERRSANKGQKLSPEAVNQITEDFKEIEKTKEKIVEQEEKMRNAQTDADVEKIAQELLGVLEKTRRDALKQMKKGLTIRDIFKEKAAEARARINARRQKLGAGQSLFDPRELADLIIIAANDLAQAGGKVKDVMAALLKEFGDAIKPYMEEIEKQAVEMLANLNDPDKSTPEERMGKAKARAVAESGEKDALPKQATVYQFARAHVMAGAHGVDKIMSETTKSLQEFFPGITERQVRDIFSGYGITISPSREAVATELRETRQLVLLERQLDALKAKQVPLKTGPQRDAPTPEMRALSKQIRDLRRKLNLPTQSPEAQLKSALDAVVTRLKNEIEDITTWIAKGGRTADEKAPRDPIQYTEEANALLKKRDELKAILAEIERKDITDIDRAAKVMAGLKKMEEELTRRIVSGEWVREKKKTETITNAEIEEKRSLIEGMRLAIKEEADKYKEQRDPVTEALDRAQKSLDHWTAIMEGRKEQGKTEPSRALSQAEEDIKLQIAAMRDVLAQERRDAKPRKSEEAKQLAQAEKTLKGLEDILTLARNPKRKTAKDTLSDDEAAVRGAILTAREELKAVRKAWQVKNSAEGDRLNREIKTLETRIKTLEKKYNSKDYAAKPKKPELTDKKLLQLQYDLREIQQKIMTDIFNARLAARTLPQRIASRVGELLHTFRAFQTGFDVSAVLRQGGFVTLGHPVMAAKILPKMFRSLFSEKARLDAENQLKKRENYQNGLYARGGLEILESGQMNLAKMEEAYMGRWVNDPPKWIKRIPVLRELFASVKGSARAYTTFLNELRADAFDTMVATLTKDGRRPPVEEAKAIAHYVNVATGRGTYGAKKLEQAAVGLNTLFFAPKYVTSRFQLMFGNPFWSGNLTTRKLIAGEYVRFLAGLSVVYGLYALFHAGDDDDKIEKNPTSSKFGKLKFGDTFLDPLSGLSQTTVFLMRMLSATQKNTAGQTKSLDPQDAGFGETNLEQVLIRFLKSKLSPVAGATWAGVTREDFEGKRTNLFREYANMVVPMAGKDIWDTWKEKGLKGAPIMVAGLFGMSVQNYQDTVSESISDADEQWMYDHQLVLPRITDDAKASTILGTSRKDKSGTKLTEEQRVKILEKSLPEVTEAIGAARKEASGIKGAAAEKEAQMGAVQKNLEKAVKDARKAAAQGVLN